MQYRVVLQGRSLGGADIEHVKHEFVRVTGLPASAADAYFTGMPQAIKRHLERVDAERIAATLRAIGAAASVEREIDDVEDAAADEIHLVANPLIVGPPSIVPGMEGGMLDAPVARTPRWMRALREKLPALAGALVLGGGAILLVPIVDEFVRTMNPPPPAAVTPTVRSAPAPVPAAAPEFDSTLLLGPWRCTDQRTGIATYWVFEGDGTLVFHGDTFGEGASGAAPQAGAPASWRLAEGHLVLAPRDGAATTFSIKELTLANLRYGDPERRVDVDCRRP